MEHRWNKRFPVDVEVLLYHHGCPVIRCKTLNVGTFGMFIGTGPVRYANNTVLEVEFEIEVSRRYKRIRRYRLPVLVVHSSSNKGIGLMLVNPEPEALLAWHQGVRRACQRPEGLSQNLKVVSNQIH